MDIWLKMPKDKRTWKKKLGETKLNSGFTWSGPIFLLLLRWDRQSRKLILMCVKLLYSHFFSPLNSSTRCLKNFNRHFLWVSDQVFLMLRVVGIDWRNKGYFNLSPGTQLHNAADCLQGVLWKSHCGRLGWFRTGGNCQQASGEPPKQMKAALNHKCAMMKVKALLPVRIIPCCYTSTLISFGSANSPPSRGLSLTP